jgi:hypothetical protein
MSVVNSSEVSYKGMGEPGKKYNSPKYIPHEIESVHCLTKTVPQKIGASHLRAEEISTSIKK